MGYTDGSHKRGVCTRHLARVVKHVLNVEGFTAEVSGAPTGRFEPTAEDAE